MIMFGAIIIIILLLGSVFLGILPGVRPQQTTAKLEFWGLYDDQGIWQPIFDAFKKDNPGVSFNYTKMNPDTYESDLLEALASGKNPDIIMFHSSWLPKHGNKISPLSQTLMTLKQFQETFPDVAVTDFVTQSQIYALPIWTDALTMFYNKDLFNTANVATPPKTWDEFIKTIQKLSSKDKSGNLVKSGTALGTADNVNHAADILGLLMIQSGAKMISDDGTEAAFDREVNVNGSVFLPGESALRFYTDFSSPKTGAYSWNNSQPNSLDAFTSGKTAIIFEYALNLPKVKEKNPNLQLGIAAMPQLAGAAKTVNYADFWGYSVPLVSKNPGAAWNFLVYLTGKDTNKYFSNAVNRPASRRDVIAEEISTPDLGVFAEEILSSANWYRVDPKGIEKIFKDMINAVILGNIKSAEAIRDAADKVTFLMGK